MLVVICSDGRMVRWPDGRMIGCSDGRMLGWPDDPMKVGRPHTKGIHSKNPSAWPCGHHGLRRLFPAIAILGICLSGGFLLFYRGSLAHMRGARNPKCNALPYGLPSVHRVICPSGQASKPCTSQLENARHLYRLVRCSDDRMIR